MGLVAFKATTVQNFRADLFEDNPSDGDKAMKATSFGKRKNGPAKCEKAFERQLRKDVQKPKQNA